MEACNPEDDRVSIASDFSIIAENVLTTDVASLSSDDIRPSSEAVNKHGKVTFMDIKSCYSQDTDIAVSFTISKDHCLKPSDCVALFATGFKAPHEYKTFECISTRTQMDENLPRTVVFKADKLPKETEEFYQFCYMTEYRDIIGVSKNFQLLSIAQLQHDSLSDSVEMDGSMIYVASKESQLNATIEQLKTEKFNLEEKIAITNGDLDEVKLLLETKTHLLAQNDCQIQKLKLELEIEVSKVEEYKKIVKSYNEQRNQLEDRIKILESQLKSTQQINHSVENDLKVLQLRCKDIETQLEDAQQEKERCKSRYEDQLESLKELNKQRHDQLVNERNEALQKLEMWSVNSSTTSFNESVDGQSLENKLEKVNEELSSKLEQLETQNKVIEDLEVKLGNTVVKMDSVNLQLESVRRELNSEKEQRLNFEERQDVVNRDNMQLKSSVDRLQMELSLAQETEKATEKVATDLRQQLLNAKDEYNNLNTIKTKLVDRVKHLMKNPRSNSFSMDSLMSEISISTCDEQNLLREDASSTAHPIQIYPHECSSTAEKVSIMERSINQLCSQVGSIKSQLEGSKILNNTDVRKTSISRATSIDDKNINTEEDASTTEQEKVIETNAEAPTETISVNAKEEDTIADDVESNIDSRISPDRQSISASDLGAAALPISEESNALYCNSFLPAPCTAPVFLPENCTRKKSSVVSISAHSASPSIYPNPDVSDKEVQSQYALPRPLQAQTVKPDTDQPSRTQAQIIDFNPRPEEDVAPRVLTLPNPIQPEPTPSAQYAATLNQINISDPTKKASADEDDHYFSAGEGEPTSRQILDNSVYYCPMCALKFPKRNSSLFEAHVERHLDRICPICSEAYPQTEEKRFHEHVQSHFSDDEISPTTNNSGPWEVVDSFVRQRNLLEID